ncbi:MAG: TspO/MBR family protein [Terriglobales bacterium]
MGATALQTWMLLLFVVINFAVAGAGARIGARNHYTEIWYNSLRKPRWYPAEWVFAPVWAIIALITGVAGWFIWGHWMNGAAATALVLYGFCLGFNAVWQGVVFGQRRLGMGVAWAWLLWGTITVTMLYTAADSTWNWLWLVPYWLWVGYCLRLNHELWTRNQVRALLPPSGLEGDAEAEPSAEPPEGGSGPNPGPLDIPPHEM